MNKVFVECPNCGHDISVELEEHDKQIREDAIDERASLLAYICKKYSIPIMGMNCTVDEWEELNEHKLIAN